MNGNKGDGMGGFAKQLQGNAAVQKLLKSEDTKRMIQLLEQQGSVQDAARSAAEGNPAQMIEMMKTLMSSKEGAQLVDRIKGQAEQAGL